jgi:enoyl-CoA hydratase
MTDEAPVVTEKQPVGVAVVRIARPEALNALNLATRQALAAAFTGLYDDPEVRCIVLTGDDKAFAAGADLKEMAEADSIEIVRRRTERYWQATQRTPQPVIAAVEGYALGGGLELAMLCDIIVAAETAQLGQPEVRVGIMPGAGGSQRLTRAVGKFHAMRLCLTGRPISGREGYEIGLVSQLVPEGEALAAALKMATDIARLPPLAVVSIKEAILQGESASLEAGLLLERKAFQVLLATEDRREGMAAFIEKRKPVFKGR